jgi:hypothetical protein
VVPARLVTRAIPAIGPGQKSANSTRSTSLPVALTKLELVGRAAQWGARRGVEFDLGRLNEWTKKGLVVDDDRNRGDNDRKRAIYRYGCPLLSACPAGAAALCTRDQADRRNPDYAVPQPLQREAARGSGTTCARVRAKINAQARSVRLDQEGAIPPKHKESLIRSLGQGDDRFVAANIVLPGAQIIEVMRAARNPDPESAQRNPKIASAETIPVAVLGSLLGGLMAAEDDDVGEAERLLRNTSNSELEAARSTLLSIRQVFASAPIASSKVILGPLREAYLASFAQPEFVTVQMVNMLRLSALSAELPFEELLRVYGFTME